MYTHLTVDGSGSHGDNTPLSVSFGKEGVEGEGEREGHR